MSTSARLDVSELTVVPGTPVSCEVVVANRGSIVDAYALTPVGDLAPYMTIEPVSLSLYPEAEGTATITIAVPLDAGIQAGDVPFGVLVEPHEHPGDTAVPEAVARVQAYSDLTAELTPRTSHGSRVGRHALAVDNRGNQPITLNLAGKDPDAVMEFRFKPSTLEVQPGSAAFAKVTARPLERIWRGQPKTRQFTIAAALVTSAAGPGVAGAAGGSARQTVVATVDGMMVQDPILPSWTGKAVAGVLAAAAVMTALWFGVLKPTIKSTAEEAVAKPIAAAAAKADEAKTKADEAGTKADEAKETAKNTSKSGTDKDKELEKRQRDLEASAAARQGQLFEQRFALSAKPGASDEQSFEVPKDKILEITDINYEGQGQTAWLDLLRDKKSIVGGVQAKHFYNIEEYRYISGPVVKSGQKLTAKLDCTLPAPGGTSCENAIFVAGLLQDKPKPPTPTPTPTPSKPS